MSFRYRHFPVYQKSLELHKLIVHTTIRLPEKFGYIQNQIRRAALSIVLNIAEGSAKSSDKDFNRYLGIALGSVDEVVAGCEVMLSENLINKDKFNEIELIANEISKQLGGFSKKLKQS